MNTWGDNAQPSCKLLWRRGLGQTAITGGKTPDKLVSFPDASERDAPVATMAIVARDPRREGRAIGY